MKKSAWNKLKGYGSSSAGAEISQEQDFAIPGAEGEKKKRRVRMAPPPTSDVDRETSLSADLRDLPYRPGRRIYEPKWDVREDEYVIGSPSTARKYLVGSLLPADRDYISKLTTENFLSEAHQIGAHNVVVLTEALQRLSLLTEREGVLLEDQRILKEDLGKARIDASTYEGLYATASQSLKSEQQRVQELEQRRVQELEQVQKRHEAELLRAQEEEANAVAQAFKEAFSSLKKLLSFKYPYLDLSNITIEAAVELHEQEEALGGGRSEDVKKEYEEEDKDTQDRVD